VDAASWHPSSVPAQPPEESVGEHESGDTGSKDQRPAEVVAGPDSTGNGPIDGPDGPGEPDPRLLFANERTFLSWIRTSLALVTAGLAIIELLPAFRYAGGRRAVGLPLIALGTFLAATAFRTWTANERAMRANEPLPRTYQALILAVGVAVVSAIALLLAAFGR
jgi:putative membrane protein